MKVFRSGVFAALWFAIANFAAHAQTSPTQGAVQPPNDNGKIGTTYKLGDKGNELHFTLESARVDLYLESPDEMLLAGKEERLLILNFTVQNPHKRDVGIGAKSFQFTATSPDDENFEFRGSLLHGTKATRLTQTLKPSQKVKCMVAFPIFPRGAGPSLMVERGEDTALRYDLTGKLDKMDSPFTMNGIDLIPPSLTPPTYRKNQAYVRMGAFALAFAGMKFTDEPILGQKPETGTQYLCIDFQVQNVMKLPAPFGFQSYTPELYLQETNEKLPWNSTVVYNKNDSMIATEMVPGFGFTARYYYKVPIGKRPRQCFFTHNSTGLRISLAVHEIEGANERR